MSILRADFSPSQAAAVDEISERTGLSFSAVVRMLLDDGLSARSGYRNSAESLPEGNSKRGGEGETPESQDPTVIETERKGSGENGESVSVPKRSRKIPVAIPDPPAEIDSPELRAFLPEFVEYRRKVKKSPLAPAGWNLLFNRLKPAGREHAVLALRYSISNGWKSFDVEWLKGKSWATVASEMGLSLTVAKPAPAPAVLDARDLARAIDDARKEIPKLAPAEDGWTSKSRTVFFEDLDACKTPADVEAHLAACRALCDRLRAMGAFPLRRATQPGEILPAGGGGPFIVSLADGAVIPTGVEFMGRPGGPLAVDLHGAFVCDSTCPACGEDQSLGPCSCGDQDDPAVGGLPEADDLAIGCDRGCPVGGPCASWPDPCPAQFAPGTTDHAADCECTACVADYEPWQGGVHPDPRAPFWSRDQAGPSSAELAAIDPPNPNFFNALSKLPPLDVSGFDNPRSARLNCPLDSGAGPCECEAMGRCPICGYTQHDALFQGDHASCPGRIPSDDDNPDFGHGEDMVGDDTPLEKLETERSGADRSPDFCPCGAPMIDDGDGGTTCIEDCRPACRICGCPIDKSAGGGLCAECKAPKLDCNANPPAETVEAAHSRLAEKGLLPTVTPADIVAEKRRVASHLDSKARVADSQHAYAHNALSGKCAWCHQDKDHIRHYLPQQLPFDNQPSDEDESRGGSPHETWED